MLQLHFTPFPVLATECLVLRRLEPTDAYEIFLLRSDESVNQFVDRPRACSTADALAFINKINTIIQNNEGLYWAILPANETKLIGTISIWNIDAENDKAEIGYELLPAFQGRGLMQEALTRIIDFCFSTLKLKTIEAWLRADNLRSLKLLEKSNFCRDFEAEARMRPEEKNMIVFSLSNPGL